MIDTTIEEFTAQRAITSGLVDAIRRGEVKLEGRYEVAKDTGLIFKQRPFTFKDRMGELRSGRFGNAAELRRFWQRYEMAV